MYRPFAEFFHEHYTPKINPILGNGIAVEHLAEVENYGNSIIASLLTKCHPDFKYLGMERATPTEAFNVTTRRKNNRKRQTSRREFDYSETYTFMAKLRFSWKGIETTPRFLELPFTGAAGMWRARGSQFSIVPILRDVLFSPGTNSLFIPLTETKQTYYRTKHPYMINGVYSMEDIVWSKIHHDSSRKGELTVDGKTSNAHYLFAKFGVIETFKRFGGVSTFLIGDSSQIQERDLPPNDWIVCNSTGQMAGLPNRKRKSNTRTVSDIRIAIPRAEWNAKCSYLVAGFFYIADRFPEYIHTSYFYRAGNNTPANSVIDKATGEIIDAVNAVADNSTGYVVHDEIELADELRLWRVAMGRLLWGDIGEGRLEDAINKHYDSVDDYVDTVSLAQLHRIGVEVYDFYDLLAHIMETFSNRIGNHSRKISSMYDKRLTILPYIFLPIAKIFAEMKRQISPSADLSLEDIETILNRLVIPETIIKINNGHGEVVATSVTSDNKIFGVTAALVAQCNSAGKSKRRSRPSLSDPTKNLDSSTAEIGGHLCSKGEDATGQERLNVFANVDAMGNVGRHEKFVELLDKTQEMIRR